MSAAGFIATSTCGASPGVVMSWSEMWIWNAETPASVPAGARISAGNSGSVARSLPNSALDAREPVARQLHAVAAVAGEPDDDPVELDHGPFGGVGHLVACPLGRGRRCPRLRVEVTGPADRARSRTIAVR